MTKKHVLTREGLRMLISVQPSTSLKRLKRLSFDRNVRMLAYGILLERRKPTGTFVTV